MAEESRLSLLDSITALALVVAAVGVTVQIASGAPYPMVPPAYFILLIPAVLIAIAGTWWAPLLAMLGGLFLIVGLLAAGQTHRLAGAVSVGDAIGLWTQMLAVLVAVVTGALATRFHLRRKSVARG